jgi:SNF2 family DNA or RNA helicase
LRRHREDILGELPERTRQVIQVTVNRKELEACDDLLKAVGGVDAIEDLLTALAERSARFARRGERVGIPFELIARAGAALAAAKIPAMLSEVESFEAAGEPLIVFSNHRAPIEALAKRPGWATIMGGMKGKSSERSSVIERFQAGKLKGIGLTIQAGGTGITLTRANSMLFVDEAWTPADNEQAADRNYRIGQTRACLIRVLAVNHPLDLRIAELNARRQSLIAASVDAAASHRSKEEAS